MRKRMSLMGAAVAALAVVLAADSAAAAPPPPVVYSVLEGRPGPATPSQLVVLGARLNTAKSALLRNPAGDVALVLRLKEKIALVLEVPIGTPEGDYTLFLDMGRRAGVLQRHVTLTNGNVLPASLDETRLAPALRVDLDDAVTVEGEPKSTLHDATKIASGTLDHARFSAYDDLVADGKIGKGADQVRAGDANFDDRYFTKTELSAAGTVNASTNPVDWTNIKGVPTDFADGADEDTTYAAGNGLTLAGTTFSAAFAGTGAATSVARSDHDHDANYFTKTALQGVGTINTATNPVDWTKLKGVPAGIATTPWTVSGGDVFRSSGRLGIGNSAPAAGIHVTSNDGALFDGASSGGIPATGAGTRMMWYPGKSAFRAGRVGYNQWDDANIGEGSTAIGIDVTAGGSTSTSIGYLNSASGLASVALGAGNQASGGGSVAIGSSSQATGDLSTAMGASTTASGASSTAMGYSTTASGMDSVAMGNTTTAGGRASMAMGELSVAGGDFSTALGFGNRADGDYGVAIGSNNEAGGSGSTAFGVGTSAVGDESTAMGYDSDASGWRSTAMGVSTFAGGDFSTAMGYGAAVFGDYGTAIGYYAEAGGTYSTAMGNTTSAGGLESTAMGRNTDAGGDYSTAMGYFTEASGDYNTAMGYYTTASGSGSTAMGGNTEASGIASTAMGDSTNASGYASAATGFQTTASGYDSMTMGKFTTASGDESVAMGDSTTAQAYASLVLGQYNTISGNTGSWVSTDPVLVVGNGNSSTASNALTLLKNGNLTIAGTLTQNSDERLKESVEELSGVLARLKDVRGVSYSFKKDVSGPQGRQLGFVAQEVKKAFPELVREDADGTLSVAYGNFSAVLLEAVKEQQKEIEAQREELKRRDADYARLAATVAALEKRLDASETRK